MFGHGSAVDAHSNFGSQPLEQAVKNSPVKRRDFHEKLKAYNDYYEGRSFTLRSKEVNGRLVIEGLLRVYWGVQNPISFKEKDDSKPPPAWRNSYCLAIHNGLDEDLLNSIDNKGDTLRPKVEPDTLPKSQGGADEIDPMDRPRSGSLSRSFKLSEQTKIEVEEPKADLDGGDDATKFNTISTPIRRNKRRNIDRRKRLSVINGHLYDLETSVFLPSRGTVTNVMVTSLDTTPSVIKMLLDKFKVKNDPDQYTLCVMKNNGERFHLDDRCPLEERVILGPLEDTARITIMEKELVTDINEEVAQYAMLPDAVLQGFLQKLEEEHEMDVRRVKNRYKKYRKLVEARMKLLTSGESTQM